MIRNLLAAIGFLCVAMAGTAAVYAARWYHDDDVERIAVSTRGLDLTTVDGRRALDRRVDRAVGRVCSSNGGYAGLWGERDCRRDARAGAEPQIKRAIDRAFDRRGGYTYVEETLEPEGYDSTPIAPEPGYLAPPRPVYRDPVYHEPAYVDPVRPAPATGPRFLRETHTTITRTPLKPRVKWVRTKNGTLVKKVVRRKLVRKTVRATYTR